ncbi:MAG: type I-MYXAN CRISPR-associated protein Cas6/Cmx6 [Blastocatellales bacterium]|nr:type I-MYXAN CRISPR-associated protein Cas6/Cmx6 [Blastocatellales bacterium]
MMAYLEMRFPINQATLPTDQGYVLFSAISRIIPEAHAADWLAVETIPGLARGDGLTQIDQESNLRIRLPQDRVHLMLKLAGKKLDLKGHSIRLGAPQIFLLRPASALYARIVTIKGYTEPEPFLDAVCRKLDQLGVKGEPVIGPRRVLKVGNHTIVGYALVIHELSDDGSLLLQEVGLGGRRHMGCGIFNPVSLDRAVGVPPERMQAITRDSDR